MSQTPHWRCKTPCCDGGRLASKPCSGMGALHKSILTYALALNSPIGSEEPITCWSLHLILQVCPSCIYNSKGWVLNRCAVRGTSAHENVLGDVERKWFDVRETFS
jgi:hypothetical protein